MFKVATTVIVILGCAFAHVDEKVKVQPVALLDENVKFAEMKPAIQAGKLFCILQEMQKANFCDKSH